MLKKLIAGWIGLCIICLMIWTPIYFLFVNDAEDNVKDLTLDEYLFTMGLLRGSSERELDARRNSVDKFASFYEDKTGIDITDSIYEKLDDDDNVKNLSLRTINVVDQKGLCLLTFTRDNTDYAIEFIAAEPSFLEPEWIPTILSGNPYQVLRAIGPSFGISNDDCNEIASMFSSHLPD